MPVTPKEILQKYWGHSHFRSSQEEAIQSVLEAKDTLVLMPTGGGKSICYQIPALIKEGICIVISPLVALIEDQVVQLKNKGIKVLSLPSGLSAFELENSLNNAEFGNYKFLYLSPERLQQELVQSRIRKMKVSFIAIDEAHCISEWGHDFRPAYLKLKILRDIQPNVSIIALTATATKIVQKDILTHLNFKQHRFFKTSYRRSNLSYGVYKTQDKNYLLQQILKKQPGAAIIYVSTRNHTKVICELLNSSNIKALPYHGGLSREVKKQHYDLWMTNKTPVIVATSAFGMGINKPDVRLVIHMHLPMSIENYFQEAGRAGRDGQQAFALLLSTGNTAQKLIQKFEAQTPDIEFIKLVYRKLFSFLQIGYGEGYHQTHSLLFSEFCNRYELYKAKVYTTLHILDNFSILRFSEVFRQQSYIQFLINADALNVYLKKNIRYAEVCHFLLRNYPGIFLAPIGVDLGVISSKINSSQNEVLLLVQKLESMGIITLDHKNKDVEITFLQPREDDITINMVSKYIRQQLAYKRKKVKTIITFLEKETSCKSKFLLNYFGEATENCGICSSCLKKKNKERNKNKIVHKEVKKSVLEILEQTEMNSRTLIDNLPIFESTDILEVLKSLLEDNIVIIQPNNTYRIKNK